MSNPRPPKRERTRRRLLDAGLRVLADRGDAFTASDVVAAADVSNGTFYNHFLNRDDFIAALANDSLRAIADESADETEGTDPAWRFAVGSTRVLETARRQPLWGRAVLRLTEHRSPPHAAVQQQLRADLADGHRLGRFTHGDDPVTIDLVTGTLMASLRRLVSPTIPSMPPAPPSSPMSLPGSSRRSVSTATRRASWPPAPTTPSETGRNPEATHPDGPERRRLPRSPCRGVRVRRPAVEEYGHPMTSGSQAHDVRPTREAATRSTRIAMGRPW
jgi:AcrR family transcriptional regulator